MRVHSRTDFDYTIVRGNPTFCRAAYACVITQSTAYPDERAIYHIEYFYGDNGVKVRSEARRYGSAIKKGKRGVSTYRETYLCSRFPKTGIPKREQEVECR